MPANTLNNNSTWSFLAKSPTKNIAMKNKIILLLFALFSLGLSAQTAKSVLDKTAALCSSGAVQVNFTAKGARGNSSGTLVAQNNKFTLQSPQANIWFDGKTEWSIVSGSDEVNVSNPSAKEIASMNPMNFVNLYKKGYKSTLKTVGNNYEVHLVATSKSQAIKEMYIYVSKTSSKPILVKMRTGSKDWTSIVVNSFKTLGKQSDAAFKYNVKDHPGMKVIDLR